MTDVRSTERCADFIYDELDTPCRLCGGTRTVGVIPIGGVGNDSQADECPWCLRRELAALISERDKWHKAAMEYEEREAAVYPEDTSFEDVIKRLASENNRLEAECAEKDQALRYVQGELLARNYANGEANGFVKELRRIESALTPDTGKRVVDVETKETIWKSK